MPLETLWFQIPGILPRRNTVQLVTEYGAYR
jgi:hypothetical protein